VSNEELEAEERDLIFTPPSPFTGKYFYARFDGKHIRFVKGSCYSRLFITQTTLIRQPFH
jgi:hypothetical protein